LVVTVRIMQMLHHNNTELVSDEYLPKLVAIHDPLLILSALHPSEPQ